MEVVFRPQQMVVGMNPQTTEIYTGSQIIREFTDSTYTYTQSTASDTWIIKHKLNRHPSVTVVDSAGTVVIGNIFYNDENTLTVTFSAAFSGIAYLN